MSAESIDPELDLLGEEPVAGEETDAAMNHAMKTTPLLTGDAYEQLSHRVFPQRALYGRVISQHTFGISERPQSPKVYINTNTPFSALVCGVQGSGKSHSTSVLLESCLMNDSRVGALPAPLSALVFHYDTAAGGGLVQPCEAAYLSTIDTAREGYTAAPLPTYLRAMSKVYAGLPHVRVEPLLFSPDDISGERLLAMMKVDENAQMPLYMESIMAILRSMEGDFDYTTFREQLSQQKFSRGQRAMLNLRLSLLDSCLQGGDSSNSVKTHFRQGHLTIIDLSSPFMDGASACGFFDMTLGLFVEAEISGSGKVVVLDEAHKYLSESHTGSSARLTDSLLTVIRQQRHLATRIIVSTQEPTVVPGKYLDLCSIIIAHRFSSPAWLKALAQHVSAADSAADELFEKIVSLQTGQAIVFAPNGLCVCSNTAASVSAKSCADTEAALLPYHKRGSVRTLGQGYLIVRSRLRLTLDGGHSLLAVSTPGTTTRLNRVSVRNDTGVTGGASSSDAIDVRTSGVSNGGFTSAVPSAVPPIPISPNDSATVRDAAYTVSPSSIGSSADAMLRSMPSGTAALEDADLNWDRVSSTTHEAAHPANISLTDTKERFIPLVKYLGRKPTSIPVGCARRRFQKKEPDVYGSDGDVINRMIQDAIDLGVITRCTSFKNRIMLIPGATYHYNGSDVPCPKGPDLRDDATVCPGGTSVLASTSSSVAPDSVARVPMSPPSHQHRVAVNSTIDMTRLQVQQYVPLVRLIQQRAGTSWLNRKGIKKYFTENAPTQYGTEGTAIEEAVSTAVRLGILEDVGGGAVRLFRTAEYIF